MVAYCGRVLRLIASYDPLGPDQRVSVGDIRERLAAQIRAVRDTPPTPLADDLLKRFRVIWK